MYNSNTAKTELLHCTHIAARVHVACRSHLPSVIVLPTRELVGDGGEVHWGLDHIKIVLHCRYSVKHHDTSMCANTHRYSEQHGVDGVPEWERLQFLVPYRTKHRSQCHLKLISGEHCGMEER